MKSVPWLVLPAVLLFSAASVGEPIRSSRPAGACQVLGALEDSNDDPLFRVLANSSSCPKDVFELRDALRLGGLSMTPFLVSNHGFHNLRAQRAVRAMLFEEVTGTMGERAISSGEFFFGHFLGGPRVERLDPLQTGDDLLVEAIAWDSRKGVFNYYELTTEDGRKGWFYRGDSLDIARDLEQLYRGSVTGRSLRCSGCHRNGGPIMKELSSPHNDWWTKARPLPLHQVSVEARLQPIFSGVADAARLADSVRKGIEKLGASPRYREARRRLTLPERLRPLFCPMELSLASDSAPLTDGADTVAIPPEFFVDSRLVASASPVRISRSHYRAVLARSRSVLGDTGSEDSDHGWLSPIKDPADLAAVDALVEEGLIDDEFVTDVLAVDVTAPAYSMARCELLQSVPLQDTDQWKDRFRERLSATSSEGAKELLQNFVQTERNAQHHRDRARGLLRACSEVLVEEKNVESLFRLLQQRREEIRTSPLAQSLEDGFRTVFPHSRELDFAPQPGSLRLDDACRVVPAR